ncbi:MAG: hypothetical protein Q8J71_07635 [Brevundimonas sp.]|nr:hypothetical protein [Brevundimonas sp.]
MDASPTRDDLVQLSRTVPKDLVGAASLGGYLLAIIGLAGLIIGGLAAVGGTPTLVDWRVGAVSLVVGAALMWRAGLIIGRRFAQRAAAAGYTPEQIREIEDEAERLNEEED